MENITFLIKPASSSCNMRCRYCFYEDVSRCRDIKNYGIMKEEVAKKIIKNIFLNHSLKRVHFAFQGGEPTLAGLIFFELFIDEVNKNKKNIKVSYSIQSNGYNLNSEWINFFKKNNFLVGISLDSYKENHDYYRKSAKYEDTYIEINKNIKFIQNNNIPLNILTVLTNDLAKNPEKAYDFCKREQFEFIQFIPCLPNLNNEEDRYSLKPEYYYSFYKKLYELWSQDIRNGKYISIGLFDNIASILSRRYPNQCGFVGKCQIQYVIESDGSVYPCDFYVLDKYKLGNIQYDNLETLLNHSNSKNFLSENTIPNKCYTCRYKKICYGQCKRQRITFIDKEYCGYQKLLDDIIEDFVRLLPQLQITILNSIKKDMG